MKKDLISIIVPVYNSEKYLNKCLTSIMNQTYKNIEIIIIDDGSTDESAKIIIELKKRDNRIKYIYKKNSGSAATRNYGIKHATGQYICFIDSDDYIDKNMIFILYKMIMKYNCQLAECDYFIIEENGAKKRCVGKNDNSIFLCANQDALKEHINGNIFKQVVWNKLYLKDILVEFIEGKTIDDEFWTYQVIYNAQKSVHINKSLYYYRQQPNSIMHQKYSLKNLQGLEAHYLKMNFIKIKSPQNYSIIQKNFFYLCLYHYQMCLIYLDDIDRKKGLRIVKDYFDKISNNITLLKNVSIKDKIWFFMSSKSIYLTCLFRNIIKIGL